MPSENRYPDWHELQDWESFPVNTWQINMGLDKTFHCLHSSFKIISINVLPSCVGCTVCMNLYCVYIIVWFLSHLQSVDKTAASMSNHLHVICVCICITLNYCWVDASTWTCFAAGVAELAGPVRSVVEVSLRARGEATAFFPQVDETQSAAQAAVLPAPDALTATRVTLLTHPWGRVSIVTTR